MKNFNIFILNTSPVGRNAYFPQSHEPSPNSEQTSNYEQIRTIAQPLPQPLQGKASHKIQDPNSIYLDSWGTLFQPYIYLTNKFGGVGKVQAIYA